MLAVKLHRDEKPWLGSGSHLIPIFNWETGEVQVKNWASILNGDSKKPYPNSTVRYMTQVRIRDDLVVKLHKDWGQAALENLAGVDPSYGFREWQDIDDATKQAIAGHMEKPGTFDDPEWAEDDPQEHGSPNYPVPQIILGEPIPESDVLWTRDLFKKRTNRSKKRAPDPRRRD